MVAQSVKPPEGPSKRCNGADVNSIPGQVIGVRGKIVATPSVGVVGETRECRYKSTWIGQVTKKTFQRCRFRSLPCTKVIALRHGLIELNVFLVEDPVVLS